MVRAFIAIDFNSKEIQKNIEKVQQELSLTGSTLKMVELQNIHLTLAFLGEISNDQIEVVKSILSSIKFHEFALELRGLFSLPNSNYIRVISSAVKGDLEVLNSIHRELQKQLKSKGFKIDSRKFTPHLTLARVKSSKNKDQLIHYISGHKDIIIGEQSINKIKLKRSVLERQGPNYSTLYEVKASNVEQ